jgi:hypothetical protein
MKRSELKEIIREILTEEFLNEGRPEVRAKLKGIVKKYDFLKKPQVFTNGAFIETTNGLKLTILFNYASPTIQYKVERGTKELAKGVVNDDPAGLKTIFDRLKVLNK